MLQVDASLSPGIVWIAAQRSHDEMIRAIDIEFRENECVLLRNEGRDTGLAGKLNKTTPTIWRAFPHALRYVNRRLHIGECVVSILMRETVDRRELIELEHEFFPCRSSGLTDIWAQIVTPPEPVEARRRGCCHPVGKVRLAQGTKECLAEMLLVEVDRIVANEDRGRPIEKLRADRTHHLVVAG